MLIFNPKKKVKASFGPIPFSDIEYKNFEFSAESYKLSYRCSCEKKNFLKMLDHTSRQMFSYFKDDIEFIFDLKSIKKIGITFNQIFQPPRLLYIAVLENFP